MSTINTNNINVNYPVPGVNNNSQGFRDNFTAIRTNLNTAATEITDLENKVVLKSALTDTTLNNDMANTLISNASTRSFRATMYNLGNALSGTVTVDCSLGDVQYGNVAADTVLQFGSWPPVGTEASIVLELGVSNANATISFPSAVIASNNNFGVTLLENYANIANVSTVTAPYGVTQLNYRLTTNDCGNTIYIEPINRPFHTTQVQQRSPSPTGFQGDTAGTVAVDDTYLYICTGDYNSTIVSVDVTQTWAANDNILVSTTGSLIQDAPIIFTGNVFGGIVENTVYYIKAIVDGTHITISDTRTSGTAGSTFAVSNDTGNCYAESYNGTDIWKRVSLTAW